MNFKINLLIDSLGSGGAQRQFVALANGLSKRGYQVRIWCYHDEPFFANDLYPAIDLVVAKGRWGWLRKTETFIGLAMAREEAVVSFLDVPNILNLGLRFIRPFVRRIVSERNVDYGAQSLRRRFTLLTYGMADSIVANSKAQQKNLGRRRSLAIKTRYIVNTVDTLKFYPRPSITTMIRSEFVKGIVVASYIPSKNPWLPIKWMEMNREQQIGFDWYGNTLKNESTEACSLYDQVLRRVKDKELERIRLHSRCSDVANLYPRYDFLCLPSFYEGTANVICEAMACGLPIVCSAVSDNPLLVEDGVNGFLFDPNSVSSFGEAISRLLALTDEDRHFMGARNRAKAVELFSEEGYIDKWEEAISMGTRTCMKNPE